MSSLQLSPRAWVSSLSGDRAALRAFRALRALRAGRWLLGALLAAEPGCRGGDECGKLDPSRQPDRVVEVCSARFAERREPSAAITVVAAHLQLRDDAAVLRWAERVGPLPGAALVWRRASQAHLRRGEPAKMIAAGERAMELWQAQGQLGEAAYEASTLSEHYSGESRLLPALTLARKARALALASDDLEMHRVSFAVLFGLLSEIGDRHETEALLRQMQRHTRDGDARAQRLLRYCEGMTHFRSGRLELARQAYLAALAIPAVDAELEATRGANYNLAEISVRSGDVTAARRHLTAALAALPPPPARPSTFMLAARAFYSGMVTLAEGVPTGAEALAREGLALQPPGEWIWQLEDLLGKALEARGDRAGALAAYRRAIAAVEALRKDLAIDVLQVALRDRKRAPYEAAFALEARGGDVAAAMAVAHLMWQRGFVEAFDDQGAVEGPNGGTNGGTSDGTNDGTNAATAAAPATEDPAIARLRGLTALAPRLAPVAAADVAGGGDPATDVLAFVEARGELWRYARIGGATRLEPLTMTAAQARPLVAALRAHPEEPAAGAQLAAALLPASALAATGRPLAIIADGALAGLPFAALRTGKRWLVEERVLQYWPVLQAFHAEAPAVSAPAAAAGHVSSALTVLAPAVGARGAPLDAAHREAIDVALVLGATAKLGKDATIAALRASGATRLLHLAAHGGLAPGGAFVRLADGEVTASDILTWKLAPRLVVLASCASGARPTGSMWGALGGAFLAAGSEAVIATLWSVEDAATATLVHAFYAADGTRDPAAALAAAQRKAISAGVSPRQWAAFLTLTSR